MTTKGRPRQATRRCPRCAGMFPREVLGTVGYCKPCATTYRRELRDRHKRVRNGDPLPIAAPVAAPTPQPAADTPAPFDPYAPGGYTHHATPNEFRMLFHGADVVRQCTRVYHALDVLTCLWAFLDNTRGKQ